MAEDENSGKRRLDVSSYKGQYPYVQVSETESGHSVVFDDTPGNERIVVAHRSGSYTEISADGKTVNFSVGDQQSYGKGGLSVTFDENGDVKIHGHARFLVGGGAHIEVAGDAGIGVGGSTTLVSMGDLKAKVDNIYLGAKGNLNFNIAGNLNVDVGGSSTYKSGGQTTVKGSTIHLNP